MKCNIKKINHSDELFVLNKNTTTFDAYDGIEERLAQIKSILNCLADTATGDVMCLSETVCNTLWIAQRLLTEVEMLQATISYT